MSAWPNSSTLVIHTSFSQMARILVDRRSSSVRQQPEDSNFIS